MKRLRGYSSIKLIMFTGIFFSIKAYDGSMRHEDEKQRRETLVEQIQQLAPKRKQKNAGPVRRKSDKITRSFQPVDVWSLNPSGLSVVDGVLNLSSKNPALTDLWGIEGVPNVSTTTTLNLSENNLKWIDSWLLKQHLPNLQVLNLTNNSITQVPDLSKLSTLTTLNLTGNPLQIFLPGSDANYTEVLNYWSTMTNLTSITLPATINEIDVSSVTNYSTLSTLLSNNSSLIWQNKSIQSMIDSNNAALTITDGVLDLSNQGITDIWGLQNVSGIGAATTVNLNDNFINWIGQDTINALDAVQVLNLSNNNINNVPDLSPLAGTLTTLNLSGNINIFQFEGGNYWANMMLMTAANSITLPNPTAGLDTTGVDTAAEMATFLGSNSTLVVQAYKDVWGLSTPPIVTDQGEGVFLLDLSNATTGQVLTELWGLEDIDGVNTVTTLNLSGNSIGYIDQFLLSNNLPNLKILNLSNNNLKTCPSLEKFAGTLTTLNLFGNNNLEQFEGSNYWANMTLMENPSAITLPAEVGFPGQKVSTIAIDKASEMATLITNNTSLSNSGVGATFNVNFDPGQLNATYTGTAVTAGWDPSGLAFTDMGAGFKNNFGFQPGTGQTVEFYDGAGAEQTVAANTYGDNIGFGIIAAKYNPAIDGFVYAPWKATGSFYGGSDKSIRIGTNKLFKGWVRLVPDGAAQTRLVSATFHPCSARLKLDNQALELDESLEFVDLDSNAKNTGGIASIGSIYGKGRRITLSPLTTTFPFGAVTLTATGADSNSALNVDKGDYAQSAVTHNPDHLGWTDDMGGKAYLFSVVDGGAQGQGQFFATKVINPAQSNMAATYEEKLAIAGSLTTQTTVSGTAVNVQMNAGKGQFSALNVIPYSSFAQGNERFIFLVGKDRTDYDVNASNGNDDGATLQVWEYNPQASSGSRFALLDSYRLGKKVYGLARVRGGDFNRHTFVVTYKGEGTTTIDGASYSEENKYFVATFFVDKWGVPQLWRKPGSSPSALDIPGKRRITIRDNNNALQDIYTGQSLDTLSAHGEPTKNGVSLVSFDDRITLIAQHATNKSLNQVQTFGLDSWSGSIYGVSADKDKPYLHNLEKERPASTTVPYASVLSYNPNPFSTADTIAVGKKHPTGGVITGGSEVAIVAYEFTDIASQVFKTNEAALGDDTIEGVTDLSGGIESLAWNPNGKEITFGTNALSGTSNGPTTGGIFMYQFEPFSRQFGATFFNDASSQDTIKSVAYFQYGNTFARHSTAANGNIKIHQKIDTVGTGGSQYVPSTPVFEDVTIKLQNDVTFTEVVNISGTVTFELNGHTLTFASSAKLTLQAGAKLIFTKGSVLGFTGTVLTSGSNSGSSVMNTLQMVDGTGEIKLKEATLTSATMVSFYQGTVSVDKYSKLINIGHFTPGGIIREGKEFEGDVDINAQIPNTDVTCTADMNMSRSCTFKSLPNFKSDTTVPRICQMKSRTLCDEYFDIENASSIPSANSPTGGSAFAKQVDAIDDSGSPLRAQHVMCHKGNGTTDPGVIRIDCFDPATQNLVKGTELTLTGAAGTVADCQWRKGVTNDNVPIDDKTATRHYVATCVAAPSVNDNGTSTYVNIYKCDIDQAYANANENALAANIINDSNGDGLSLVTNGSLSLPAGQAVKAMAWHPKGKYLTVVVQLAGPTYEVRMYPVKKNGEINTASVITATFTGSAISAPSTAKRPLRWTPKGKILMYAGQNCLESFIFDGKTLKRGSTLTTGLEAASGQTNNICIEPHPFDDICIVGQTVGAATAQKGLRQISYNSKGVLIDTTKTNPDALAVLGAAVIINDLSYHKTGTIISCATSDGVKMVPCDTNKKQFYKAGAIGADSDVTLLNKDSNVTTAHFAAGGTKLIRNSVDGANNAPKIHTLPTNTKGSIARINMELEGDTCHFGTIECSEDSTINLNGGSLDLTPVTVYSIKSGKTLTIQGGTIHGLSGDILNVTDDSTTTHVKKAFNFDFEDDTAAVSFKDCTLDLDSDIAFCCGTVNIEGQVIVTGGHSLVVPKEGTAFVHIASGAQVIANSGDASSVDIDSSKTDNLDALSVAATTDTDLATLQEMNKDDLSIATIGGKNKLKASSKYDSSGVAISNVLEGGTAANPAIIPLAAGSETEWGGPSVTVLNGEIRFDGPTGENDAPAEITISDHQSFMLAENAVIRCTGKVNFNVQSGACLDLGANALIECGSSATKDIDKVNVIINGGELKTNSATAHLNVAAYGKGTFTAINGATCDHQSGGGVVFGGKGSRVSYTDGDGVTVASQTAAGTVDSSLTLLKIDSTFELKGPEEASIVEPIFDIYDNAEGVSVTTNIGNFKVTGQATVSDTTSGDPYLINPEGAAQKVASDTTQNVSQRLGGTEFLNTMPSGQKQGVMNDGAVAALPSNTTTAVLRAGFTYSDGTSTPEYIESRNNKQEVYYSISNGDGTTTTSATPPARS